MTIHDPNTSLLTSAKGTPSDNTPAPLSGAKNTVSFLDKEVGPPASLYIQRDDSITVGMFSSSASLTFTLTARVLRPDTGEIISHQFLMAAPSAYALNLFTTNLDEGFLLSIVVQAGAGQAQSGAMFVTCVLNRNLASAIFGLPGQVLIRDYVTAIAPLTWPGGRMTLPQEGPGNPRVITVANPGAGADWTQTVQNAANWELVAFSAVLTTSAAAANRQPRLILDDTATTFFDGAPVGNIPATTTATVSGAQLPPTLSTSLLDFSLPIPPRNFLAGPLSWRIRMSTAGIQAGDQWSNIRLLVREWLAN